MRLKKIVLTTAVASAIVLGTTTTGVAGADDENPSGRGPGQGTSTEVLTALQRDLGLTPTQARRLAARQTKAIKADRKLQRALGEAFAGSVFNAATGRLTVMVSDDSEVAAVKKAGATPKVVKHSMTELEAVTAALDAAAGRSDVKASDRKAGGDAKEFAAGLNSWYIDPASNTVHVTVEKGEAAAAAKKLAKFGDAVTVVEAPAPAVPTDRYVDGGDAYNWNSCSIGFNVRNKTTGQGYVLTAGHCVSTGSTLVGHDGTNFGKVLESWFPSFDDALVRNDSAGYWIQGPWVDKNPTHGSVLTVKGYTDAPVGTAICKSGRTTLYTCGNITAKNETVTYSGGSTVYGLTRHDACVEKGDSGGANVSLKWNWSTWTIDYAAEGMTSGARLYTKDGKLRCGEAVGEPNVSWYFPVADSLAYYGPKYGVSIW